MPPLYLRQVVFFVQKMGSTTVGVLGAHVRQLTHVIFLEQPPHAGAEETLADDDGVDGRDQVRLGGILQQVGAGSPL